MLSIKDTTPHHATPRYYDTPYHTTLSLGIIRHMTSHMTNHTSTYINTHICGCGGSGGSFTHALTHSLTTTHLLTPPHPNPTPSTSSHTHTHVHTHALPRILHHQPTGFGFRFPISTHSLTHNTDTRQTKDFWVVCFVLFVCCRQTPKGGRYTNTTPVRQTKSWAR